MLPSATDRLLQDGSGALEQSTPFPPPPGERTMRRRALRSGLGLAAIAFFAGTALAVGAGIWTVTEDIRTTRRLDALALQAEVVIGQLREAETAQRGYLLTVQPEYLVSYNAGVTGARAAASTLLSRAAGVRQPVGVAARAERLRGLTDLKLAELEATLTALRTQGPEATIVLIRTDEGRRLMDEARNEAGLLRGETAEAARRLQIAGGWRMALALGAVLGLASLGATMLLVALRRSRASADAALEGTRAAEAEAISAGARATEATARASGVFATAPLGLAVLDADLRFLAINPWLAEAQEGQTKAQIGMTVADLAPDLAEQLDQPFREALANPGLLREIVVARNIGATTRHWRVLHRAEQAGYTVTLTIAVQDITDQRALEGERDLLLFELKHRVKNVLATVQALAGQTWAGADGNGERFIEAFGARLRAMARAQDMLNSGGWTTSTLNDTVSAALGPWGEAVVAAGEGGDALLGPQQAMMVVLALHELATNAAKYGAMSVTGGQVTLSWLTTDDGDVLLDWQERGGPPVAPPPGRRGFGSALIQAAFARYDGQDAAVFDFAPEGLSVRMRLTPNGGSEGTGS
ncbi:two-component sensor histidine kinase [Humitalea rosea]|uniref:histidine kinase n=1 Tax=Humitalea rosea TaxID=990373 RepID=A0A2W7I113_9PROT|nr:CHASE3 domain-containing protein [Humitalea rosea]PZW38945.1 two-component sensor histidine kinase [Humitalea rosea]